MTNNHGAVLPPSVWPLELMAPDKQVHTFQDEPAFVEMLLRCEHEPSMTFQYDPAPMETYRYEAAKGCRKCGSVFLAGSWEGARPAAGVPSAEFREAGGAPCPVPRAGGEARPRWRERFTGFLRAFWWGVAVWPAPRGER